MGKNKIRFLGVAVILVVTALPASAADWRPRHPQIPDNFQWVDRDRIRQETVTAYIIRGGPQRRLLTMYKMVDSKVAGANPDQSGIRFGRDPNKLDSAMDCATGQGFTLRRGKDYGGGLIVGRGEDWEDWIEDTVKASDNIPELFKLVCGR